MGDSPSGGAGAPECATGAYPPRIWLELAIQLLAEQPGNDFSPLDVLDLNTGVCTRRAPCCHVRETSTGSPSLYFGREEKGYVVVSPAMAIEGWPTSDGGRLLPIRLARWILGAGDWQVARHTCDNPSCIARAHLVSGAQSENLADAIARGRRQSTVATTRTRTRTRDASADPPRMAAAVPSSSSGEERSVDASKDARFPMAGFLSPSKKARKMRRQHPYARPPRAARLAARIPLAPAGG